MLGGKLGKIIAAIDIGANIAIQVEHAQFAVQLTLRGLKL